MFRSGGTKISYIQKTSYAFLVKFDLIQLKENKSFFNPCITLKRCSNKEKKVIKKKKKKSLSKKIKAKQKQ